MATYISYWNKLHSLYYNNKLVVIDVRLIGQYLDIISRFNAIAQSNSVSENCRNALLDAVEEIDWCMNDIIKLAKEKFGNTY
ncbi:MAG: hypothetical protein SF123_11675 [Chloroflexota bacterium]|nr:hypothetical protein [Chloroflexota bacterium]